MSTVNERTELASLQTDVLGVNARIDVIQGKMDIEKDETTLRVLKKEMETEKLEFDNIQGKVNKIKESIRDQEKIARDEVAAEIAVLADSKVHGKQIREDAEARVQGKDERLQMGAVAEYMRGGKLGGKELRDLPSKLQEQLRPTSSGFETGASGIKLPKSAVDMIMGKDYSDRWLGKTGLMDMIAGKASCSGTGDYSTVPFASQNTSMTAAAIWTEYKRNLLDLPGEAANILNRVTTVPAQSGIAQWVRTTSTDAAEYAAVVASWLTCEGDNKTQTQIKFETFDITAYELQAWTQITDRALNRSLVPIESLLSTKFREAVLHALETAVLVGTGAGQPTGIIDTAGVHQVGRDCNTDVKCEDLIELKYALRAQHRPGAMFALQDQAMKALELDRFGTDCDCNVHCLENGRLVGHDWMSTHRLPAVGTAGDVIFGDFSNYILAMEQEIVLARSSEAADSFRRNSTAFKIYMIVGGEVAQPRAFAQLDDCTKGGSCVCT